MNFSWKKHKNNIKNGILLIILWLQFYFLVEKYIIVFIIASIYTGLLILKVFFDHVKTELNKIKQFISYLNNIIDSHLLYLDFWLCFPLNKLGYYIIFSSLPILSWILYVLNDTDSITINKKSKISEMKFYLFMEFFFLFGITFYYILFNIINSDLTIISGILISFLISVSICLSLFCLKKKNIRTWHQMILDRILKFGNKLDSDGDGIGFNISPKGIILTAYHVIQKKSPENMEGRNNIKNSSKVIFDNTIRRNDYSFYSYALKKKVNAELIEFFPDPVDIAILKIQSPCKKNLPYFKIEMAQYPEKPLEGIHLENNRVNSQLVSYEQLEVRKKQKNKFSDINSHKNFYKFDNQNKISKNFHSDSNYLFIDGQGNLHKGDSGGPLLDDEMKVFGILISKKSSSDLCQFSLLNNIKKSLNEFGIF